jgi:hypothetical protein
MIFFSNVTTWRVHEVRARFGEFGFDQFVQRLVQLYAMIRKSHTLGLLNLAPSCIIGPDDFALIGAS